MNKKTGLSTLLLFGAAFLWGTGFIATQIAIDAGYGTSFIIMSRFVTAAVVFGALFWKDVREIKLSDLKGGLTAGTSLFLGFLFQTYGLKYTSLSNNAFITASAVVIVPVLVWAVFRKRPPVRAFVASFVCLVGVFFLTSGGAGVNFSNFSVGDMLTLVCAFFFALHTMSVSHFAPKMNPKILNFIQLTTAAVLAFVAFMATGEMSIHITPSVSLFSLLYLGVFTTCIAYFLQTEAQKYAAASRVAVIISTESLFALLLSVTLGYEMLSLQLVVGGVMILSSVVITSAD